MSKYNDRAIQKLISALKEDGHCPDDYGLLSECFKLNCCDCWKKALTAKSTEDTDGLSKSD